MLALKHKSLARFPLYLITKHGRIWAAKWIIWTGPETTTRRRFRRRRGARCPGGPPVFLSKIDFFFLSSLLVWRSLRLYEGKSVIGAQCVISIVFRVTKPSRGAINAISGGRPQIYSPLMACRTHCLDGVGTCYYILLL